jgi:hypothetical protein
VLDVVGGLGEEDGDVRIVEGVDDPLALPLAYHYQRTKARLGRQRGARVAQVELARRLAEAIWHMLTRNQPFAPAGATNLSGT